MQQELLDKLRRITEEEQLILQGASDIQSDLQRNDHTYPEWNRPVGLTGGRPPFPQSECNT